MPKHIFVVEDTPDLRANIIELLQMEGYRVTSAVNGKEAIALLNEIKADLIITDLVMPEMDGFDLIIQVRKNLKWKNLPILVFTAMPPIETAKKVLEMGANSYIKKPSSLDDLLESIKNLIG
jgi:DNA-binding response OmpR family regulator